MTEKDKKLAGGLGFEPRLAEAESAGLPLDDPPIPGCKVQAGPPAPFTIINASSTADACAPCAGRPSCAPPRGRRGGGGRRGAGGGAAGRRAPPARGRGRGGGRPPGRGGRRRARGRRGPG